jgi:hypothetical protein
VPADPSPPELPPSLETLGRLAERARSGDAEALDRLRAYLDANPEVWRQAGDLAAAAESAWIALCAGDDALAAESLARRLAELKAELAGPDPSPLERLLVERIAACWLQVQHADALAARPGEVSLKQVGFAGRRQDAAHRRYLQAVGALATLRRLLPAAVVPVAKPPVPDAGGRPRLAVVAEDPDDPARTRYRGSSR